MGSQLLILFLFLEFVPPLVAASLVSGGVVLGGVIELGTRTTLVRLSDGGLWLHSPGPLTPTIQTWLEQNGPLRAIVAPNLFHHMFLAETAAAFPDAMQPVIQALPLTALNDALRAVLLDGASLFALTGWLAILALWCVGSFGVALKIFRWS